MRWPHIHLSIEFTIGPKKDEDTTVDLVGTHQTIPPATHDIGFHPDYD